MTPEADQPAEIGPLSESTEEESEIRQDPRSRRLRALLHTQPVHALELNKASRGKDKYAPYDLILLQLEAIDYITDNMDPHRGVPEEEVQRHLAGLAAEMAPRRGQAEHREVASVVLNGLENEGEGQFLVGYSDPTNPRSRVRADVELLRAVQGEDGGVELRATPQAINLLLDALDADIESAEDAMAYMFQLQFGRGRLGKAAEHAQSMRRLSISYREQIQDFLAAAARDITRIDWSGEVMAAIDRAYSHLETRLREDATTSERVADQHEATPEPDRRQKLAEILELVEDCNRHHRELHSQLMNARHQLREHHAQQRLTPPPSIALVDMHAQILQPSLSLPLQDVIHLLEVLAAGLAPPLPTRIVDLSSLANHQWRSRWERNPGLRPVEKIELEEDGQVAPRFSSEAITAATDILSRTDLDQPLSDLLQEASEPGLPNGTDHLLGLGALEAFMETGTVEAGDDEGSQAWRLVPKGLRAEHVRRRLETDRFGGDDLHLTNKEPGGE